MNSVNSNSRQRILYSSQYIEMNRGARVKICISRGGAELTRRYLKNVSVMRGKVSDAFAFFKKKFSFNRNKSI